MMLTSLRGQEARTCPFLAISFALPYSLYVLPHFLSPGHCRGIVQGLSVRFKYTLECETDFYLILIVLSLDPSLFLRQTTINVLPPCSHEVTERFNAHVGQADTRS
jgi:hypothetical protein